MGDDTTVSMMRTVVAAVCVLGFVACGKQGAGAIDAPGSGIIDAPIVPVDQAQVVPDARFAGPIALAAASDFNHAGMAGALELATGDVTMDATPGAVGRDPVVRFTGGYFAIINRYGDAPIVLLHPASLQVVYMLSTGAGTKPQDIAIAGNKAFVPTLGTAGVEVFDLGSSTPRTIDLSSFDVDGKPDCESAYVADGRVIVACALLDATFKPRGPGKIAVIDPAGESVSSSFDLPAADPIGFLEPAGTELVIETVPNFSDLTMGCIARVKTAGTPSANGCLVGNATLGGYASAMAIDATGTTLYATSSTGALLSIGYPGGGVTTMQPPTGFLFIAVAACSTGDLALTMVPKSTGDGGFQLLHAGALVYPAPKSMGIAPQNANALACN